LADVDDCAVTETGESQAVVTQRVTAPIDARTRRLIETSTHPLHAAVYQAAKKRPAMEVVYYSRTVGRQDDV